MNDDELSKATPKSIWLRKAELDREVREHNWNNEEIAHFLPFTALFYMFNVQGGKRFFIAFYFDLK